MEIGGQKFVRRRLVELHMNLQRDFIVAIILVVTVLTAGSRELPAQRKAGVKRNMTVSVGVPAQQDVSEKRTEENTATLQETLDWLQSKMSILKTYTKTIDSPDMSGDNTDVSRFEPGSFNSCTIVWREITGNSIVNNRYISEITIPLSDIDPHSIRTRDTKCLGGGDCHYVELSSTKSIKVHYSTNIDDLTDLRVSQPRDTDKTRRVLLLNSLTLVETEQDEELAHRISGAMKHAVKLCCSGPNCNSNSNLPVVDSELPQEAAEKAAMKHVFSEICPALLILPNLKADRVCADVFVDCSENPPLTSADKANGMEDKWCVEVSYTMRSKPPPGIFREWPDGKTSVLAYKEKGTWKAARIDVGNCACRNRTLQAR